MNKRITAITTTLGVTVLLVLIGLSSRNAAFAQSGTRGQAPVQKETFESRIWTYLGSVCYHQWSPALDSGDFQQSEAPHGALVKTYMNRTAAGNPKTLPHGSMIIKENFSPDKKLMAITLMYRTKDYNPEANDWYWVKFDPKGNVAQMDTPAGKMAIAGKAKGCIECHSGADGGDFAFFND